MDKNSEVRERPSREAPAYLALHSSCVGLLRQQEVSGSDQQDIASDDVGESAA